jgi:hypothetical protein
MTARFGLFAMMYRAYLLLIHKTPGRKSTEVEGEERQTKRRQGKGKHIDRIAKDGASIYFLRPSIALHSHSMPSSTPAPDKALEALSR